MSRHRRQQRKRQRRARERQAEQARFWVNFIDHQGERLVVRQRASYATVTGVRIEGTRVDVTLALRGPLAAEVAPRAGFLAKGWTV